MLRVLMPNDIKKNGLLYSSALLTWFLVSFISLSQIESVFTVAWQGVALLSFILLFFTSIFFAHQHNAFKQSIIITLQIFILWLLIGNNNDFAPILLCLVTSQLPSLCTRLQAMLVIAVINIGFYIITYWFVENTNIYSVLIYLLLQLFAFSSIETAQRAEQAREKLALVNNELVTTRFMLKETGKQQERLRISRDLHDSIGHQLTALSLNLQVLKHKVTDIYKEDVQQNYEQAQQLLGNVREVVKEMRTAAQIDLIAQLQQLLTELPNCQLTIEKSLNINSLQLKQQLLFCLQEAVSNGIRHGKATEFILSMSKQANSLQVTLANNGKAYQNQPYGSGLQGMQERLAPFNGTIDLVNTISGCELQIKSEDNYD